MLTKKEVEHIAALARIGLDDSEIEKFSEDLSSILNWVEQLKEVDIEGVEPTAHITGMKNVDRKDEMEEFGFLGRTAILKNAPETKDNSLKVKSIL